MRQCKCGRTVLLASSSPTSRVSIEKIERESAGVLPPAIFNSPVGAKQTKSAKAAKNHRLATFPRHRVLRMTPLFTAKRPRPKGIISTLREQGANILRGFSNAKELWAFVFTNQNNTLVFIAGGVLIALLFAAVTMQWRRRRRRRVRLSLRPTTLDLAAVARTRSRTDSWSRDNASLLRQQQRRRIFSSSSGVVRGDGGPLQSRDRSFSVEQQPPPFRGGRAASPGAGVLSPDFQTSVDSFRDFDLRTEEVQWVAEDLLEQLLESEERKREQWLSPSSRSRIRTRSAAIPPPSAAGSSNTSKSLRLLGPSVDTISFRTLTPPPTWAEASRRLVVTDLAWKLSRDVSLHLLENGNDNTTNPATAQEHPVGTAKLVIREVLPTTTTTGSSNSFAFDIHNSSQNTHEQQYRRKQQQQLLREIERKAFRRAVTDCSIHVKRPAEGGVLELYEKESPAEWMEHTFRTAAEAAQFQGDFLALQVLGPALHNMYQALALVHRSSVAFDGDEPVMQYQYQPNDLLSIKKTADDEDNQEPKNAAKDRKSDPRPVIARDTGIAWDDVMRCLGSSFPSIRLRLEALRWLEVHGSMVPPTSPGSKKRGLSPTREQFPSVSTAINMDPAKEPGGVSFLKPEYLGKRLLLGPVDFFRLFVPPMPETAVPEDESSRNRMEQMLRWRKRVARASVLVQAYTRAKAVRWNLGRNVQLPDNYLHRRLAYDDNTDNKLRDASIQNEYYETTVSRDVVCPVRGSGDLEDTSWWELGLGKSSPTAMSLYQAYSLVGIHAFEWPGRSASEMGFDELPLLPHKDPVRCITSLRALIAAHPELDFFVHAHFLEAQQVVFVQCFVRSLPKGVDPKFDAVVSYDVLFVVVVFDKSCFRFCSCR